MQGPIPRRKPEHSRKCVLPFVYCVTIIISVLPRSRGTSCYGLTAVVVFSARVQHARGKQMLLLMSEEKYCRA